MAILSSCPFESYLHMPSHRCKPISSFVQWFSAGVPIDHLQDISTAIMPVSLGGEVLFKSWRLLLKQVGVSDEVAQQRGNSPRILLVHKCWCADSGRLQSLQWNDVTCGGCGGRNTSQCLSARSTDGVQYSCAGIESAYCLRFTARFGTFCVSSLWESPLSMVSFSMRALDSTVTRGGAVSSNCTTAANSTTLSDPCLPAIYLGFSGSDKHERTFQSGYQIRKINQFSLVGFYQRASSRVSIRLANISAASPIYDVSTHLPAMYCHNCCIILLLYYYIVSYHR
jgi:hypothetical protein